MGRVKERYIELESRGFGEVPDRHICAKCVVDVALSSVVDANLKSCKCDYCGISSTGQIAAPFEVVMERIYESITTEYADAQHAGVPYDSGWILESVEPFDILSEFNPGWADMVAEDVLNAIGYDKYWVPCSRGYWASNNPSEILMAGWDKFKSQVLTKTRYLFLSEPCDECNDIETDSLPVSRMLDKVGEMAKKYDLVTPLPIKTMLFRVHHRDRARQFETFDDVGVPPREKAVSGRMNPSGIPYLYLATDEHTATQEVIMKEHTEYVVASFFIKRNIKVLDLSKIPVSVSLFDPERYSERHEGYFLKHFRREIAQPVKKDGQEHIEYIPTQIVSEFFRYRFKTDDGDKIDGILYPSAVSKEGNNVALFVSDNKLAKEILGLYGIGLN